MIRSACERAVVFRVGGLTYGLAVAGEFMPQELDYSSFVNDWRLELPPGDECGIFVFEGTAICGREEDDEPTYFGTWRRATEAELKMLGETGTPWPVFVPSL